MLPTRVAWAGGGGESAEEEKEKGGRGGGCPGGKIVLDCLIVDRDIYDKHITEQPTD